MTAILTVLLLVAGDIYAFNYFVAPPPLGNDSNSGTSWASPFATIQKAISTASEGQSIAVTNGVYTNVPVNINKGVSVIGVNGPQVTKISGVSSNWKKRCVIMTSANALLDGFTLEKGGIMINEGYGGGLYISAGTVNNCIITNCLAWFQDMVGGGASGGGIYATGGFVKNTIIRNCRAYGWNSVAWGGGIYTRGGIFSNISVISCVATVFMSDVAHGGGVYIDSPSVKIYDSLIISNRANGQTHSSSGGGVRMNCGLIMNSTIAYNYCERGHAGGIFMLGGTSINIRVYNNIVSHRPFVGGNANAAGVYIMGGLIYGASIVSNYAWPWNGGVGGGVVLDGSSAAVVNSFISHNYTHNTSGGAVGSGGGAYMYSGLIRGCMIYANGVTNSGSYYKTCYGGGIYMQGGKVESSTVVHNYAAVSGGGIYRTAGEVLNTVIWSNYAPSVQNIALNTNSVTYSCAPSLTAGTGNITDSPGFVLWGNGYGFTAVDGNYHIGSLASKIVDKGLNQGWMLTEKDIDSQKRIVNDRVDMGADEIYQSKGMVVVIR